MADPVTNPTAWPLVLKAVKDYDLGISKTKPDALIAEWNLYLAQFNMELVHVFYNRKTKMVESRVLPLE